MKGMRIAVAINEHTLDHLDQLAGENQNRTVDLPDHHLFVKCLTDPGKDLQPGCSCADENGDRDVDLSDFATLQTTFTAPVP